MAYQAPTVDQPLDQFPLIFSIDEAAFRAWWAAETEDPGTRLDDFYDDAAEVAGSLTSADAAWLTAQSDFQVLAYLIYADGVRDGFLLTVRRDGWPYGERGFQLATMHIDHSDMRDEFADGDPLIFAQALVDIANSVVTEALTLSPAPFRPASAQPVRAASDQCWWCEEFLGPGEEAQVIVGVDVGHGDDETEVIHHVRCVQEWADRQATSIKDRRLLDRYRDLQADRAEMTAFEDGGRPHDAPHRWEDLDDAAVAMLDEFAQALSSNTESAIS